MFEHIEVGDVVTRLLAGSIPMRLQVTELTEDHIICGWWTFSRKNGAEIDEDLGWTELQTGSFLKKEL
jgi:hypothetical protein